MHTPRAHHGGLAGRVRMTGAEAGREAAHAALARVVAPLQGESTLGSGVSKHQLPKSVDLRTVARFLDASPEAGRRVFLGANAAGLVVSCSFAHECVPRKRKRDSPTLAEKLVERLTGSKRKKDTLDEEVERAADRVREALGTEQHDRLARAQTALTALLDSVRGSEGESCVESWGLSTGGTAPSPKLVLAVRFSPGVALPLFDIRKALGKTYGDGMLSCGEDSATESRPLPLTESGIVARAAGAVSVAMHVAVS